MGVLWETNSRGVTSTQERVRWLLLRPTRVQRGCSPPTHSADTNLASGDLQTFWTIHPVLDDIQREPASDRPQSKWGEFDAKASGLSSGRPGFGWLSGSALTLGTSPGASKQAAA